MARSASVRVPAPEPPELGTEERDMLLAVARTAVAVAAHARPAEDLDAVLRSARQGRAGGVQGAAFVTLYADGELRACMGTRSAAAALPDAVADAALSAALDDPRFPSLHADELPGLRLEVSVLGAFVEAPDPRALRIGVDGVMVERDGRRGLLLPEVAPELGWDVPQLLSAACEKAWLPSHAWRESGTRIYAFRTVRFGGPARP